MDNAADPRVGKPDRDQDLAGRVALITGGSSGIGLATALRFVQAGARAVLLARDDAQLRSAAQEVAQIAGDDKVLPVPCDVTREEQVAGAFEKARQHFNRLDIVVSNAGYADSAPFEDTSLAMWQKTMDINATGAFLVSREAVRAYKRQGAGGVIVFISSDNGLKPSKNASAYNASKAAVNHLARSIAEECGPAGIRVNTILPGAVFGRSGFWTPEYRAKRAASRGFDPDKLEEEYKKAVALGVIILPEEVAELALFLASDRSGKITGTMVSIDGGGATGYVR